MDRAAKRFPRFIKTLGYIGVVLGFIGMVLITYALVDNMYSLFTKPSAVQGAALVLPIQAKGIFYVPFLYWIISIFIIAVIHEFSHGLLARAHNVKVKSSGFAFLGAVVPIIPAAFVEPDEAQLNKKPIGPQLSVFAAGPFANIIAAFAFLGIMLLLTPFILNNIVTQEVMITGVAEGYGAEQAGITANESIISIDDQKINSRSELSKVLAEKKPGDIIELQTNRTVYNLTLAENPGSKAQAYMGVNISEKFGINPSFEQKNGKTLASFILWLIGLINVLFFLNLGIGLFNLAPIGPLDGGRMLLVTLKRYLKKELADKIFLYVSLALFLIIIIIVLSPYFL